MKFTQIPYQRYEIEKLQAAFEAFSARAEQGTEQLLSARKEFWNSVIMYQTASALAFCRFTLNTKDEFYQAEKGYYDRVSPQATHIMTEYGKIMLAHRAQAEGKVNPILFKKYECAEKSFAPCVEEDCRLENEISTEYSKFMSELSVQWQGKAQPLSVVRGFLQDNDREVRKAAASAIGKALQSGRERLDDIFDRLVKVRTKIAQKLGYKNFVELGYYRMERIDYDRAMVEQFRKNVQQDLVPAIAKLKEEVAQELKLGNLYFYDDQIYNANGEPRPFGNTQQIMAAAQEMYDEMHPALGSCMRSMQENEAFDVEARDGKWGGGYCEGLLQYKQPFILANFNGTAGDVDVMTHEFGHAYAFARSFEAEDPEPGIGGMETAECHSMSMEFFAEKYMDKFFTDPAAYCRSHLLQSLCFIPYGVIVDEFQHIVYENPQLTPAQRNEAYLKLEEKYRPYLSFEGIPYLEEGTRWQYQMHIFESPFYYIDYCLAQTVALGFFVKMREDYSGALKTYLNFVEAGGSKPFSTLVREAGLPDPFGTGTLKTLAEKITVIAEEERNSAK